MSIRKKKRQQQRASRRLRKARWEAQNRERELVQRATHKLAGIRKGAGYPNLFFRDRKQVT